MNLYVKLSAESKYVIRFFLGPVIRKLKKIVKKRYFFTFNGRFYQ